MVESIVSAQVSSRLLAIGASLLVGLLITIAFDQGPIFSTHSLLVFFSIILGPITGIVSIMRYGNYYSTFFWIFSGSVPIFLIARNFNCGRIFLFSVGLFAWIALGLTATLASML